MPICDSCGRRLDESRGKFYSRHSGSIGGAVNASLGWGGVSKKSRKRVGYSGGRKVYKEVFVCFGCRPPPSAEDTRIERVIWCWIWILIFGVLWALFQEIILGVPVLISGIVLLLSQKPKDPSEEKTPEELAIIAKANAAAEASAKRLAERKEKELAFTTAYDFIKVPVPKSVTKMTSTELDVETKEFDLTTQMQLLEEFENTASISEKVKQDIFENASSDYEIAKRWLECKKYVDI